MATDDQNTPTPMADGVSVPRRKFPHTPLPTPPEQGAAPKSIIGNFNEGAPDSIPITSREEDPRTRAARRAAELRDHLGGMEEGTDDFFVDPRVVPPGWTYEWKRHTTLGAQDPAYEVQIARAGWEAVPAYRHPDMMPKGYEGVTILRKGMILMERPTEIVSDAKAIELRKARNQVRQKEQQLHGAPAGENSPFANNNKGNPLVNISKSYEPMPIPADK